MKNVPENELFSAYVDGELTGDEQAQVEQLLADSPAARQLVDELRALSSSLQALPVHKIGEDISARVLRRAEREMLSQPAPAEMTRPAASEPESYPWKGVLRRMVRPRNLVWPAAAVAVALLLMLTDLGRFRETPDGSLVVRAPEEAGAPGAAPSMAAVEEMEAEVDADMVSDAASAEAAPREEAFMLRELSRPSDFVAGKADAPQSMPAPAPEAPAQAAEPPAPAAPARSARSALAESPPASQPARAPAMGRPGGERAGYGPEKGGAGGMGGVGFGIAASRETAGKRGRERGEEVRERMEPGDPFSKAPEAAKAPGLAVEKPSRGAMADDAEPAAKPGPVAERPDPSLLVVSYRVTAAAARQGVFNQLIKNQAIEQLTDLGSAQGKRSLASGMAAGALVQDRESLPAAGVAKALPNMVQVDVEATRDQLSALLGDLDNRAHQFSFLAYDDSAWRMHALDEAAPRGPAPTMRAYADPVRRARRAPADGEDSLRKKSERANLDALLSGRGLEEGVDRAPRQAGAEPAAAVEADAASEALPRDAFRQQAMGQREERQQNEEMEEAKDAAAGVAGKKEKERTPAEPKDAPRFAAPVLVEMENARTDVARYRVRFLFEVVDRFDVAASMDGQTRAGEATAAEALPMAEPAEPPAAAAGAPAPGGQP